MGDQDEHWCSLCKTKVTKTDGYLELNWHKDDTHLRGLCCSKCMQLDTPFIDLWKEVLKLPNPIFSAKVTCQVTDKCLDFAPSDNLAGNCAHLVWLENILYCSRLHQGYTSIPKGKIKELFHFRGGLYMNPLVRSRPSAVVKQRDLMLQSQAQAAQSLPK